MKTVKLSVLISALFLLVGFNVNAQNANTILKKMDDVMFSAKDQSATIKIILTDKGGSVRTREATIKQKGNSMRLFRFVKPASQAGISILSLPNDVMYLYMPAFGKVRRISSSVKSQNFAGTDFSYDDMESKPYSEKYTPKLLKTEAGDFVLQLIPKSKRSAYSKIIVTIDKINGYPVKMEFYDRGNKKFKVADYQFKKIGKYWNASVITMTNLKKHHQTKMIMSSVKYDQGLSDEDFTVRKLEQ